MGSGAFDRPDCRNCCRVAAVESLIYVRDRRGRYVVLPMPKGDRTVRKRGIHLLCSREPIHGTKHHTFRLFAATLVGAQMLLDRTMNESSCTPSSVPLTAGMAYR